MPSATSVTPGGTPSHIVDYTATGLSRAIHAREVSCAEVLDAYLAQVDRLNPVVNALVDRKSVV